MDGGNERVEVLGGGCGAQGENVRAELLKIYLYGESY